MQVRQITAGQSSLTRGGRKNICAILAVRMPSAQCFQTRLSGKGVTGSVIFKVCSATVGKSIKGLGICHFPLTIKEESLAVSEEYMCTGVFNNETKGVPIQLSNHKLISFPFPTIQTEFSFTVLKYSLTPGQIEDLKQRVRGIPKERNLC